MICLKNKKYIFLLLFIFPIVAFATEKLSKYDISYAPQVNRTLEQINPQEMWENLKTLTSYPDRSAYHDTGVQAADWIKTQIETMAKKYGRDDISVYKIEMGNSHFNDEIIASDPHDYGFIKQPNIVLKIGSSLEPGIVIGAHIDTLTCEHEQCKKPENERTSLEDDGWDDPLPGADDDGSGVVTLMEMARTLFASGQHFKKPIYIIWYSAEEPGDLGSQHVVTEFKKQHIPIEVVMQLDQTGYVWDNDPAVYLDIDHTDKELTDYLAALTTTYLKLPVKYTYGNGGSDHEIWEWAGYKTVRLAEDYSHSPSNPYMHSSKDTMDKLSLNHMTDYLKLALALVVEQAEPIV